MKNPSVKIDGKVIRSESHRHYLIVARGISVIDGFRHVVADSAYVVGYSDNLESAVKRAAKKDGGVVVDLREASAAHGCLDLREAGYRFVERAARP